MLKIKKSICLTLSVLVLFFTGGCSEKSKNQTETEPISGRQTVTVTLPEGYTLVKMAMTFEKTGMFTAKQFIRAAESFDYSQYAFLSESFGNMNVCFKLEGYLSPDTYEFYIDETPETVIKKLLDQRDKELTGAVRNRTETLGMTLHEVLTLASLIEKESYRSEDKAKISSVFHNRLNAEKGGVNPTKLQSNVTDTYTDYVIAEAYPDSAEYYREYYDTYICEGLPAGPVCNPSVSSIMAALYPDETDYYYFAITEKGAKYAVDYKEHKENCSALGIKGG